MAGSYFCLVVAVGLFFDRTSFLAGSGGGCHKKKSK
jgi:hypothetical protein